MLSLIDLIIHFMDTLDSIFRNKKYFCFNWLPPVFNSLPNDIFLDPSNLKEFADDNFKFNKNDQKFSKRVKNNVWNGEIACYEQIFLFPQCFKSLDLQTRENQGLFEKGLIGKCKILVWCRITNKNSVLRNCCFFAVSLFAQFLTEILCKM